jgi:hypothetical protein
MTKIKATQKNYNRLVRGSKKITRTNDVLEAETHTPRVRKAQCGSMRGKH